MCQNYCFNFCKIVLVFVLETSKACLFLNFLVLYQFDP